MSRDRVEKSRARAEHLLDLFLALRGRCAMLHPLAFDQGLAQRVGTGPQGHGYLILRNALLQGCVQDIVKLALDKSAQAPSVHNLMATLRDTEVLELLREDYSTVPPLRHVGPGDPLPPEVLEEIRSREREGLRSKFDETWVELCGLWPELAEGERMAGFKTWRDTLIAHSDLHHSDGTYRLTDLSTLGLNWGDLDLAVAQLQEVVDRINLLTRSASFAWEMLDEQVGNASKTFWDLLRKPQGHNGGAV